MGVTGWSSKGRFNHSNTGPRILFQKGRDFLNFGHFILCAQGKQDKAIMIEGFHIPYWDSNKQVYSYVWTPIKKIDIKIKIATSSLSQYCRKKSGREIRETYFSFIDSNSEIALDIPTVLTALKTPFRSSHRSCVKLCCCCHSPANTTHS